MDAYLILDGQWGSCGKGLLAGKLAIDRNPDLAVCNFGPNAGHTFITAAGEQVLTRQIPTALVNPGTILVIGPGAIIDPVVLQAEIDQFDGQYNISRRLLIHERAAIVLEQDRVAELSLAGIASTRKGAGAAQVRKLMRSSSPVAPAVARDFYLGTELAGNIISAHRYRELMEHAGLVQIESAQGLELSLNHGSHYPYCTSRDVTPEAILNDVGVSARHLVETHVVVRTYPIRVGNEYANDGSIIGTSGPVYPDMQELSWEDLSSRVGRPLLERTTVTAKVRRVFTWSPSQFERLLKTVGPCQVMLNFCNYLHPSAKRFTDLDADGQRFIDSIHNTAWEHGSELVWLGFGPGYSDVENYTIPDFRPEPRAFSGSSARRSAGRRTP